MCEAVAVSIKDKADILRWRNLHFNRIKMKNSKIISQTEHNEFWTQKIETEEYRLYKIMDSNQAKAVLSFFDFQELSCHWGFYLTTAGEVDKWRTLIKTELNALKIARDLGIKTLYCETQKANEVVLNLHKKLGFIETADQPYFDLVKLKKII